MLIARVTNDQGDTVTSDLFDQHARAAMFCIENSQVGDTCSIIEAYKSLTELVEYGTIDTWVRQQENKYE